MELNKIYSDLLEKYSKQIDQKDTFENRKCCCKKGCRGCCYQLIIISDFEKELLRNTIISLPLNEQKILYKKVKSEIKKLRENNLTYEYVTPTMPIEFVRGAQEKYFDLNIRCPFLRNDDSCSIYNNRPISCMTYRNYGNPHDCVKNVFVKDSITFNDIEIDFALELLEKTGENLSVFNILQNALYEIFMNMNIIKKLYFLI